MDGPSADERQCPGCGRKSVVKAGPAAEATRLSHCRRLYCIGTILLLIPALSPLWLGPMTHALVGFHPGPGSGWIIEEVGGRFLFAAISTASAITGAYLFTSAIGIRFNRKPGL